jgi:putative acetyltransferase
MNIRPETPYDYADIADLHTRAFGRTPEALIVSLLRHRREFDPELSLVAEVDGRVVGHALFLPYTIFLLGQPVGAVNLAPLGINPDYQKRGIGAALVEEGHRVARAKGHTVSFLLGHDTYYPRFGYKTGVYGVSSVIIPGDVLPRRGWGESPLKVRAPVDADIPILLDLWRREESGVDFAVLPGDLLLDWVSPDARVDNHVFLRDGEVVGFMHLRETEPTSPRLFLAADHEAAVEMAAYTLSIGTIVTLPLHPYSASAGAFNTQPEAQAWNAAMACSLAPSPFDDYYEQLQTGKRLPGRVIWPVAFDVA